MSLVSLRASLNLSILIAALASILSPSPAASGEQLRYGWTISKSISDPFANTGSPSGEVEPLYLWYQCSVGDGMTGARCFRDWLLHNKRKCAQLYGFEWLLQCRRLCVSLVGCRRVPDGTCCRWQLACPTHDSGRFVSGPRYESNTRDGRMPGLSPLSSSNRLYRLRRYRGGTSLHSLRGRKQPLRDYTSICQRHELGFSQSTLSIDCCRL